MTLGLGLGMPKHEAQIAPPPPPAIAPEWDVDAGTTVRDATTGTEVESQG